MQVPNRTQPDAPVNICTCSDIGHVLGGRNGLRGPRRRIRRRIPDPHGVDAGTENQERGLQHME